MRLDNGSQTHQRSSTDLTNGSNTNNILLFLSVLLGICLTVSSRLFNLTKYGLWEDEVFSLRFARLDWSSLFHSVIQDAVHPPLFYILLKLWIIAGGDSLLWLKTLPVIFAVGAIVPLYFLCRSLTIKSGEFCLALIIISLNSYLIYYAQELRMYSLLGFLSLTSMWLFARLLQDRSNSKLLVILLFVANLLLVYTHYFGWITLLAEGLVVLLYYRSKLNGFFTQLIAVGLCFLPWCLLTVSAVINKGGLAQNMAWNEKPRLSDIPYLVAEFQGTLSIRHAVLAGTVIFTPPLLIWIWQSYKQTNPEDSLIFAFLGLVTALPILTTFSASQAFSTSIWVDRYLIAASIPYILLMAVSVSRVKNMWFKRVFTALIVCWSLGVGVWNVYEQRSRVNWISLSNTILERESNVTPPENVFVFENWTGMPLQQLLDANGNQRSVVQKIVAIEEITDGEFWLSYRLTAWKDPEAVKEKIRRANCLIKDELTDKTDDDTVELLLVSCNK